MTSKAKVTEILPPSPAPIVVAAEHVAALSEQFYELFSDVRPLGVRDLEYFRGLLNDFGADLDVVEELKRFQAWALDKGQTASQYPRSRFRDWLSRARQFKHHSRPRAEH